MYFASPTVGWVGSLLTNTLAGPLLATTDGGKHWARQLSPPASVTTSVRFFDTRRGYALEVPFGAPGSPPVLYATADGGGSWTRVQTPPNQYAGAYADFADFDHGWFATFGFDRGRAPFSLYSTSDGGAHWAELLTLGPDRPESHGVRAGFITGFFFADARRGWVMASEPGRPVLYMTEDGGQSWRNQEVTLPARAASDWNVFLARPVLRPDGAGVMAAFTEQPQASVMYSTSDGGRTWSPPHPLPASNEAQLAMPDATHVWGAIDSKLWASDDFGASWHQLFSLAGGYTFASLVALDPLHAWASALLPGPCPGNVTLNNCVTNKSSGKLLSTSDGGKHWTDVVLPA